MAPWPASMLDSMAVFPASAIWTAMPVDCPMMQKAASAVGDAAHTPEKTMDGKSHQGCQTCQLCMSLATLDSLSEKLPEPEPFGSPLALADRYASAELFEDSKPPIS